MYKIKIQEPIFGIQIPTSIFKVVCLTNFFSHLLFFQACINERKLIFFGGNACSSGENFLCDTFTYDTGIDNNLV